MFCEALRNRAGIERMTVELANLLCAAFEVSIVTIDAFSKEECPYAISERVEVTSLNSYFKKSVFSLNRRNIVLLRRWLKRVKPETLVAVATPMVRIAVPAAVGLGIKVIGWEHFNIFAGSKIGAIYKAIAPWFVSKTVVLTEADARDYQKFLTPRIESIPNFTSIGSAAPSECESKIALAVGRHAHQKGFDMLIKAWAKTEAEGWKLRIVGSGAEKAKNEALARELNVEDRIEFREATPEIVKEFQDASCFVLSSRYEGLVLVLIEAKMMGLPSVCFDCPNSPREVVRDGIDGWLVEAENIDGLAAQLTKRLNAPDCLKRAGKMAREDALRRYSAESVAARWTKILS